ncbi:MAG: LysR family transcriptional regulator [Gammaproteobacteria bacterium]|nr:MAG: LysR family transcriptional regulator [Gammaproteobacteria bacterium]
MTLTQLRYLVAISDSGLNITQAAEQVHATQPGLSKQLKQLEDELGFQLFSRKGKSLAAITPAGQQVIDRARIILAEARNIRALAANLRGDDKGELSITTTHTQARFVLPSAIAQLKQRYPAVNVHLKAHGDAQVMGLFERGQADLAIISTTGTPPGDGLAVPLFRWRRAVIVPQGHALASLKRALKLADLDGQPLVSYESSLRPESSLRRAFAAAGVVPRFSCTSRDADLIKTYVRAGLGIGILAEMALSADDERDLRVIDGGVLFPECTTWLVLRRDRVLRAYTATLAELIAPQLDPRDLQRALAGEEPAAWPTPPLWSEIEKKAKRAARAA